MLLRGRPLHTSPARTHLPPSDHTTRRTLRLSRRPEHGSKCRRASVGQCAAEGRCTVGGLHRFYIFTHPEPFSHSPDLADIAPPRTPPRPFDVGGNPSVWRSQTASPVQAQQDDTDELKVDKFGVGGKRNGPRCQSHDSQQWVGPDSTTLGAGARSEHFLLEQYYRKAQHRASYRSGMPKSADSDVSAVSGMCLYVIFVCVRVLAADVDVRVFLSAYAPVHVCASEFAVFACAFPHQRRQTRTLPHKFYTPTPPHPPSPPPQCSQNCHVPKPSSPGEEQPEAAAAAAAVGGYWT